MLQAFGLGLLLGNQHAVAPGGFHLHVGDSRSRGGARQYCTGSLVTRTSSHKPSMSHWSGNEGILRVDVQAPEQGRGAFLEQDAPIAHVTARAAVLHGSASRFSERVRPSFRACRSSPETTSNRPIRSPSCPGRARAASARNLRHGLVGIIQHLPLVFDRHFHRAMPAMLRVHVGKAFQAHPHDAQRRQLIVDRPLVIATP